MGQSSIMSFLWVMLVFEEVLLLWRWLVFDSIQSLKTLERTCSACTTRKIWTLSSRFDENLGSPVALLVGDDIFELLQVDYRGSNVKCVGPRTRYPFSLNDSCHLHSGLGTLLYPLLFSMPGQMDRCLRQNQRRTHAWPPVSRFEACIRHVQCSRKPQSRTCASSVPVVRW